MAAGGTLLVTTVKNEGPNILEWVAWHRLCGFDRIMVFQNGSTDLTQRTLKVLHNLGLIEYAENETGPSSPQIRAYARASDSGAFREADWCLAIDADEFFVSRVADGSVQALIERIGSSDGILINWRNFGSSRQTTLSDALVTERFTHTVPADRVAETLTGFKSLFRTDAFSRIGIHNARYPRKTAPVLVNGSGLSAGQFEKLNWRCKDPGGMALAQISHFPLRDASSFVLKTLRGRGHQDGFGDWPRYWARFECNAVEDRTLADRAGEIRAEMVRLDGLSDGRLMGIRERSLRFWRKALEEAMQEPGPRSLFDQVCAMIDASGGGA